MPIILESPTGSGGGGSVAVTDGSTTVNPATEVDFTSGATVTDGGGGIAQVAINATAGVNSVAATDTSIVVAGTATDPTIATGTLDAIATDHPPAADWSNNSNKITGVTDPASAQDAATKNYVDNAITGLEWKAATRLATAAALPTNTYNNGVAGVGATLTATVNGALTVDGTAVATADRVLVKNEVAGANDGIYVVTAAGSVGTPYVLTRATDYDQAAEITQGASSAVVSGTANAETAWTLTTAGVITVGTTSLVYAQIAAQAVSSVFARTGAVTAQSGDYTAAQVGALASTASLDVIAAANATAADVSMNTHKLTNLTNGSSAQDAAAFGQLPVIDTVLPWYVERICFLPDSTPQGTWVAASSSTNVMGLEDNNATKAQNDALGFTVTLAAGTWTFKAMVATTAASGIITVSLDGSSVGTIDTYSATTTNNVPTSITGIVVAATGKKAVLLTMATKNASSTAYRLLISHFVFIRTA